jgi:hypothetical protein
MEVIMNKIYKYSLREEPGFPQQIYMLRGVDVLSFRYQSSAFGNGPVMWASVPADARPDDTDIHTFILHFTGDTIRSNEIYLGTDISPDGIVWHLFEILE